MTMTMMAAQFPHLKAYLGSGSRAADALNFEQLLGFLYAVSSAPDVVEVCEWIPFVFEGGVPEPGGDLESRQVVEELMSLYNYIDRQVFECRVELPPECAPLPAVLDNLDPDCGLSRWSQGFAAGHDWLEDSWEASVGDDIDDELDQQLGGCMAVLSFFASRDMAQTLHEEFGTGARTLDERAQSMLELLPEALNAYADIGRSLAEGTPRAIFEQTAAQFEASAELGPADPCPCASGKTVAYCCGIAHQLH